MSKMKFLVTSYHPSGRKFHRDKVVAESKELAESIILEARPEADAAEAIDSQALLELAMELHNSDVEAIPPITVGDTAIPLTGDGFQDGFEA